MLSQNQKIENEMLTCMPFKDEICTICNWFEWAHLLSSAHIPTMFLESMVFLELCCKLTRKKTNLFIFFVVHYRKYV